MRVLFPFVGETIGGSHHSATLLIRELPSVNVEPVVLLHRHGPLEKFLADHGITSQALTTLPMWDGGGLLWSAISFFAVAPRLWWQLRRLGVNIVHVNDGRMAISWCLACRFAGVPLVIHQRTRFTPSRLSALALSMAKKVLAISQFTLATLPENLLGKSSVLLNPFEKIAPSNRKVARAEVANELDIDEARPLIVLVGTLQRQKRPLVALQALAILRNVGIDAMLLVVGRDSGDAAREVELCIDELKLAKNVRVLGFRSDAKNMIAAADALIAPAVEEGHGRAVIEAMLTGTPVVAAYSGGHVEIIRHGSTGILVEPDSPEALAAAVIQLLKNKANASTMATLAREDAVRHYSVEGHVNAIVGIYRSIMGGR